MRALLTCLLAFLVVAKASHAQTCRGRPGFTKAMIAVNAGAAMASDARSTSAGVTAGSREEGPLASVSAGYVIRYASNTFESEQTGPSLGASVAYAGTELDGRLDLCVGLGISQIKVTGEFVSAGRSTLTQTTRRAGVSAGYPLTTSPNVRVVPFASVEYAWFGGSVSGDVNFPVPDDTYVPVSLGLGTVWSDRFAITVSLIIPTALPTARNTFVTSATLALGSR